MKNVKDGGIIVKCKTKEETEKVRKEVEKCMGKQYQIKVPEQKNPCVKIVDFEENMPGEELIRCLKRQNAFLRGDDVKLEVIVMKKMLTRYMAIVECDPKTHLTMINEKTVCIGWTPVCRVFDYVPMLRCFSCGGYNHKAENCKTPNICVKCGEEGHKKDNLLFGGWAYPPSYPLYQSWHLFNELHVYNVLANRWTSVSTLNTPPPVAGHSATVIEDHMIVFGGLQKPSTAVHCEKTNDIWILDMQTWTWKKKEIESNPKPNGRFGQTQVVLDKENILILGGSGGPSNQYYDAWILNMSECVWKWKKVKIEGTCNEPITLWGNPGCKIGDKIVVLNRLKESETSPITYYPKTTWLNNRTVPDDGRLARIDLASRPPDMDENVNGKRGTLRNQKREVSLDEEAIPGNSKDTRFKEKIKHLNNSSGINMAAFNGPDNRRLQDSEKMKEKRIASLLKVEENLALKGAYKREKKTHYLGMYVLDISQVLSDDPVARWLSPKNVKNGPEETILYSLVEGKSELIMFGGIQKDANSVGWPMNMSSQISNSLHFITAPNCVI